MFILVQRFTQYDICKMTVTHNDRVFLLKITVQHLESKNLVEKWLVGESKKAVEDDGWCILQ